jgi:hypothetical protein
VWCAFHEHFSGAGEVKSRGSGSGRVVAGRSSSLIMFTCGKKTQLGALGVSMSRTTCSLWPPMQFF